MAPAHRAQRVVLYLLMAMPLIYILSAAYVGLNGHQVWRQADVHAHTLGFTGEQGFAPFEDFMGERSVYDIPFYEYTIAKLSLLTRTDPLAVTKYVNVVLWLLMAWSGWHLAESIHRKSGMIFIFVIGTSPLLLHYFSVPMPDAAALALLMSALCLLIRGQLGNMQLALVCVLLSMATLIKSPVTFVFVVFYLVWLGSGVLFRRERAAMISRLPWRSVAIPLFVALASALLAELLRNRILGQELARFAQDPAWYFGALELRVSIDLWSTAAERFQAASTRYLGTVYFVVMLLAAHPAFKVDVSVTIAAIAAYVSGWLVFPVLYQVHDYYQLPGIVLAYVAVAASARGVWSWLTEKLPRVGLGRSRRLGYEHILLAGLALYAVAATVRMDGISEFRRTSVYDAMEYALREQDRFLYVDDDQAFQDNVGPAIGGKTMTRFRHMDRVEFESDCSRWISEYQAVLVRGASNCLRGYRGRASFYLSGDGYELLILEDPQEP